MSEAKMDFRDMDKDTGKNVWSFRQSDHWTQSDSLADLNLVGHASFHVVSTPVAERRLKAPVGITVPSFQPSLRDGFQLFAANPWVETHGYIRTSLRDVIEASADPRARDPL